MVMDDPLLILFYCFFYLCKDPGTVRGLNDLREKVGGHVVADIDRSLRCLSEAVISIEL